MLKLHNIGTRCWSIPESSVMTGSGKCPICSIREGAKKSILSKYKKCDEKTFFVQVLRNIYEKGRKNFCPPRELKGGGGGQGLWDMSPIKSIFY